MKQSLYVARSAYMRLADRIACCTLLAWLTLCSHPAFADLPKALEPGDSSEGDWIALLRYYLKQGINVLVLAVAAFAFVRIASGALTKWDEYRKGRADLADMKEYVVGGSVVLVIMVALLTAANKML
jgi:integrating conjugative element membrane protein (TIGR03745 family)